MDKNINIYLDKVGSGLLLPEDEKNDILDEIKSHIYEAVNRGETLKNVLIKLGAPQKLAKSYNHSYKLENNQFKFSDILSSLAFYSSVALSGIFVISVLPIVTVSFVFCVVIILGVTALNMIGITHIPFTIAPNILVTGWPQVGIAVVVSAILLLIARASWLGLKKYLKFVSTNYHNRRVG